MFFALLSLAAAVLGQFPSMPAIPGFSVSASHGPTITTKLSDAYKQMPELDSFRPAVTRSLTWLPRTASGGFVLLPGAYTWTVQSYCLNAAKRGPRGDAAYLAAPLRGPSAARLSSTLQSIERSSASQDDAQTAVWLITSQQDLLKEIGSIQQMMTARSMMSVLASSSTPAKNHGIPRNRWTYLKPGYFVRLANTSYKLVDVEVYVPERWRMKRDSGHRVSSLSNGTGSRLDLSYQGQTASVRVVQESIVNSSAPKTASATMSYAGGANQSDAAALQQFEAAIRATINPSSSWNAVREQAADDVTRTRAELVCKEVPCNATPADFPHVPVVKQTKDKRGRPTIALGSGPAFDLTTIAGVPPDASLQSLAMSNRDEAGLPPPTEPEDKSADKKADCPEVADTIRLQKLARKMYGIQKYIAMAAALHKSAAAYNSAMVKVIGDLFNSGATFADVPSASVDASVQSALSSPKPTMSNGNAQQAAGNVDVGVVAFTDLETCHDYLTFDGFRSPEIIKDAAMKHEDAHVDTCTRSKQASHKVIDTPKTRGDDEVRAYNVSIPFLEDWYAKQKCTQ